MGTASQVIFSEDNKQLLVIVKGTNMTSQLGFLAVWDVDEDYALSQDFDSVPLPSSSNFPFSITVVPGQNAYLVTDALLGFDIFSSVHGSSNSSDQHNIESYGQRIPNQITTCWSAYSSKTGNYYLADLNKNRITEVNLDENLEATIVNVGGSILYCSIIPLTLESVLSNRPRSHGHVNSFNRGSRVCYCVHLTSVFSTQELFRSSFLYELVTLIKSVEVHSLNGPGKAEFIQRYNYTTYADSAGIKIGKFVFKSPLASRKNCLPDGANLAGMATFLKKA